MRERKALAALAVAAVGGAFVLGGCGGGDSTSEASNGTNNGRMKHQEAMKDHGNAMKDQGGAMKDHGGTMKEG